MIKHFIKVHKQYFNFASAHFLIFSDGSREPLHGHNYRVEFLGGSNELQSDMVFDFLDIKPLIRQACDALDHKFLLPIDNKHVRYNTLENQTQIVINNICEFVIPTKDIKFLPIANCSAERLAMFLCNDIEERIFKAFNFKFCELEIMVEETPGQCAIYRKNPKDILTL